MSRALRRDRRILAYADGLEHGSYTGTATTLSRETPSEVRELGETHRVPDAVGCYGLFSGHGGAVAADICSRNFVAAVLEDERFDKAPLTALSNAVAAMEAFITSKSTIDRMYYGTTLVFVLIRNGTLYTANVGDCRAVLATTDSVVRLTEDHTLVHHDELARVKAAGAYVSNGRLNGLLTYTRSLGDLHFKTRKHIFFPGQNFSSDILSAEPHLSSAVIGADALFVLLATDSVWRYLSDSAATAMVRASLAKGENSRAAARRVAQAAISHGAEGHVSVLVILVQDAALEKNEKQRFGSHSRNRSVRRVSATSSAGLDSHVTPATPPRPLARSAPVTPLKKTIAEERNRDFSSTPSTPPRKTHSSPVRKTRSLSRSSLYTPSGRGRKSRVLVPVALWGVAPGGKAPLEEVEIPKIGYPPPSPRSHRKTRSRANSEARTPERRRTMDPETMSALASPVRKVSLSPGSRRRTEVESPGDTVRRRTDVEAAMERRRQRAEAEAELGRRDSFGVPPSLMGRERGVIEDTSAADVVSASGHTATARVSHVTASSGKTAGSGDFKDHEMFGTGASMAVEFGRGGPAKVRYREHDLFGFLRRRARPASRHS